MYLYITKLSLFPKFKSQFHTAIANLVISFNCIILRKQKNVTSNVLNNVLCVQQDCLFIRLKSFNFQTHLQFHVTSIIQN